MIRSYSPLAPDKPFISSSRSHLPFVPKNRSHPQGVHILGPCQANHSYLQAFMPASAAIIVFTSSMRSYLPSMPNIALTPTNHSKPLCTTKMGLIGQKRVSGTLLSQSMRYGSEAQASKPIWPSASETFNRKNKVMRAQKITPRPDAKAAKQSPLTLT